MHAIQEVASVAMGQKLESGSKNIRVAVLLATYNGSRYVEEQIRSLRENSVPFKLHWHDDGSTDGTLDIVRRAAENTGVLLEEYHHQQHEGVPGAFFFLLESVDADIYLFCDQDDIWQPGKIDAAFQSLKSDLSRPALCFSDALMFRNGTPDVAYRLSAVMRARMDLAVQEPRAFMSAIPHGHTQGFTRPLRDLYLQHRQIARDYALMHDLWMYVIAVAAGNVRYLPDSPTTLYRTHDNNSSDNISGWHGDGLGRLVMTWRQHQYFRRALARHAEGFLMAAATLPPGPKLERLRSVAMLLSSIHRRQNLSDLLRLLSLGVLWPSKRHATQLALACLCSNA